MIKSESISNVAAALAKAHANLPQIKRERTVKVRMKAGGEYTFSYAPLEVIMNAVRAPLAAQGLFIAQSIVTGLENKPFIRTLVTHTTGEFLGNDVPIFVADPGPQAYGSAMTYARRYGITSLLCLATDDDDDGNAGEGNDAVVKGRKGKQAVLRDEPPPSEDRSKLVAAMDVAAKKGTTALKEFWTPLNPDQRKMVGLETQVKAKKIARDTDNGVTITEVLA